MMFVKDKLIETFGQTAAGTESRAERALISCVEDVFDAINAYSSGETNPIALTAIATGFNDWAQKTGATINQLNSDIDTVFSHAPMEDRFPAALNVGWTATSVAGNIVGGIQIMRGFSAFGRTGDFGNPAVRGSMSNQSYAEGDTLFRVYGGKSPQTSPWATTSNPGNQINAIRTLALPPGNAGTTISNIIVTSPFIGETSIANSMFGMPGGAVQVLISDLSSVFFSPGTILPVGIMPFTPPDLFSNH